MGLENLKSVFADTTKFTRTDLTTFNSKYDNIISPSTSLIKDAPDFTPKTDNDVTINPFTTPPIKDVSDFTPKTTNDVTINPFPKSDITTLTSEFSIESEPQIVDYMGNDHATGFTPNLEHKATSLFIGDTSLYRIITEPQTVNYMGDDHATGFTANLKHKDPTLFVGDTSLYRIEVEPQEVDYFNSPEYPVVPGFTANFNTIGSTFGPGEIGNSKFIDVSSQFSTTDGSNLGRTADNPYSISDLGDINIQGIIDGDDFSYTQNSYYSNIAEVTPYTEAGFRGTEPYIVYDMGNDTFEFQGGDRRKAFIESSAGVAHNDTISLLSKASLLPKLGKIKYSKTLYEKVVGKTPGDTDSVAADVAYALNIAGNLGGKGSVQRGNVFQVVGNIASDGDPSVYGLDPLNVTTPPENIRSDNRDWNADILTIGNGDVLSSILGGNTPQHSELVEIFITRQTEYFTRGLAYPPIGGGFDFSIGGLVSAFTGGGDSAVGAGPLQHQGKPAKSNKSEPWSAAANKERETIDFEKEPIGPYENIPNLDGNDSYLWDGDAATKTATYLTDDKHTEMPIATSAVDVDGPDSDKIDMALTGTGVGMNSEHGMPLYFKDLRDNSYIFFQAYVDGLTDTFSPTWNPENYIGRSEPVYTYSGTTREIGFKLKLVAQSREQQDIIYEKINRLSSLCYPEYAQDGIDGFDKVRMKPPLTKFRLGELWGSSGNEMTGFIKSLSYTIPDTSPWDTMDGSRVPHMIDVDIGFQPIHLEVPSLEFARDKPPGENTTPNKHTFFGITTKAIEPTSGE